MNAAPDPPLPDRPLAGSAMRELTGQRVATGALLAVIMTVLCNWHERDTTRPMAMATLYGSTGVDDEGYAEFALNVARDSVLPDLFSYERVDRSDGTVLFARDYELANGDVDDLRERDIMNVTVIKEGSDEVVYGLFDDRQAAFDDAVVELMTEFLILIVWILGVTAFAGPVMILVVQPIERMVNLLELMMRDPLGYSSSPEYRVLRNEDDKIAADSMWPREVLKGTW